jgi:hypothetical protein
MTKEEREVMRIALELLAIGTFMNPRLQAERNDIIDAGLKCLANDALEKMAKNARELGLEY